MSSGAPQGASLGPLFFNIKIPEKLIYPFDVLVFSALQKE
jgi:hypothetical protein